MAKNCLIVNTGSASKKYSFYNENENVYTAHFEKEGESLILSETINGKKEKKTVDSVDYPKSASLVIKSLVENKILESEDDLQAIGIRIVAPGNYFLETQEITSEYIKKAEKTLEKVPLHLGPALEEVKNLKKIFNDTIPIIGVSDSVFHKTIPDENRIYSIPINDTREFEIYRFGYHGISCQSIISQVKDILGYIPEKTVVCHLGGGASISAILKGKSINNSMGFTPLEGLTMATRVGDIDPGVVLYLSEKLNKSHNELEKYFNSQCGLLGLSGKSDDMRELLKGEREGDNDCKLALKVYKERVRENISKMATNLGGIDLLVFAGTVGERSYVQRERICEGMEYMGVKLDKKKNNLNEGDVLDIGDENSRAKILIIKTNEMEEIAKEVYKLSD
ncbi:MAG: acetate/propionate family kinase [Patescibacteria group bacterium]|jgi:acetate kinase|nr:acetate/propionate family kinase [Patescibacteria group bacterium]